MTIHPLAASNAYRNQLKLSENAGGSAEEGSSSGVSFSSLLGQSLENAADKQYQTESMQMEALTVGKVDLADLVTAVSSAELTLNTVVAIRDRVIGAYQDIIRMPI